MARIEAVAVIGGGRWARVLAETVHKLVGPMRRVTLHSQHCSDAVATWLQEKRLADSIGISAEMPSGSEVASSAVIIVNAARDHEAVTAFALNAGAPVLVEKPIALTLKGAEDLVNLAHLTSGKLAAANVFLFARYIRRFATHLSAKSKKIQSMHVRWVDPQGEFRYGEVKSYDAGLPVFKDVLPHVSAILSALFPSAEHTCKDLHFFRGGAQLEIEIEVNEIPCKIIIARNGDRRERSITANLERDTIQLDFATEPGTISDAGELRDADPHWHIQSRPLASMLHSFLRWADELEFDARLSTDAAVGACALMDQVSILYNRQLISWLKSPVSLSDHQSLRYAADEILLAEGHLEPVVLEQYRSRLISGDLELIVQLLMSEQRRALLDQSRLESRT